MNNKEKLVFFTLSFAMLSLTAGCTTFAPENGSSSGLEANSEASPNIFSKKAVDSASDQFRSSTGSQSSTEADWQNDNAGDTLSMDDASSLWTRIRAGFRMKPLDSPLIARHERWIVENDKFREAMIERANLYLYFIVEEVEKRGMPMEIALLPAIESAYKPYAYSRARASGLWQFIPSTGRLYGLKANWWYDGRRDVIASTRAALDYLQKLHDDFDGDWHLALAAYNAGEGRVGRAVAYNRRKGLPTNFEHLRQLKSETKNYVPKLMAMVNIVGDPEKYGISLADIPNEPYFTAVDTGSQVDLGVVAKLTGMPVDQLHHINPGYTRWTTAPDGPHRVLVPVEKKDALIEGLSNLPDNERVQWRQHTVRRGDTLHRIARNYNLSVAAIKSANNLRSNVLHIGQSIMLPTSSSAKLPTMRASHNRSVVHRVRSGDTLWGIARRYNVLVKQLIEWNVLDPNAVLQLGQKLKVFTSSPSALYNEPRSVANV